MLFGSLPSSLRGLSLALPMCLLSGTNSEPNGREGFAAEKCSTCADFIRHTDIQLVKLGTYLGRRRRLFAVCLEPRADWSGGSSEYDSFLFLRLLFGMGSYLLRPFIVIKVWRRGI